VSDSHSLRITLNHPNKHMKILCPGINQVGMLLTQIGHLSNVQVWTPSANNFLLNFPHESLKFLGCRFQPLQQAQNFFSCDSSARYFDNVSSDMRKTYFGDAFSGHGWEFTDKYYFAQSVAYSKLVARNLKSYFQGGDEILIATPANPLDYYFASRFQSDVIINESPSHFSNLRELKVATSPPFNQKAYHKVIFPTFDVNEIEALSHTPARFYVTGVDERESYQLSRMVIRSGYWDTTSPGFLSTYFGERVEIKELSMRLLQLGITSLVDYIKEFQALCRSFLVSLNAEASEETREIQISRWTDRTLCQISFYVDLIHYFGPVNKLEFVEIGDHDAGLSGPLFSFCCYQNIPSRVLEHSGWVGGPIPKRFGPNFSSPGSSSSWSHYGFIPHECLDLKSTLSLDALSESTVFILLNSFDLPCGVAELPLDDYFDLLNEMIVGLEGLDMEVLIRPKPPYLAKTLSYFAGRFNKRFSMVEDADLTGAIKQSSICINFGVPSTLCIDFFRAGIPVVYLIESATPEHLTTILPNSYHGQGSISQQVRDLIYVLGRKR
jgi:hypothetical protein